MCTYVFSITPVPRPIRIVRECFKLQSGKLNLLLYVRWDRQTYIRDVYGFWFFPNCLQVFVASMLSSRTLIFICSMSSLYVLYIHNSHY